MQVQQEVDAIAVERMRDEKLNTMRLLGREMSSPEVIDRHEKRTNSINSLLSEATAAIRGEQKGENDG